MSDILLLLLLLLAVGCGWLLGRSGFPSLLRRKKTVIRRLPYYQGLNYLLNEDHADALDAFISALEVTPDTLETHLAVGKLLRRKGEVDSAIKIHHNLLARPGLSKLQLQQAKLELARDFITAGLLDRAERLLEDLQEEATDLQPVARQLLMEIYRDEREWQRAIEIGKLLAPRRSLLKSPPAESLEVWASLAHFCCELAEEALARHDTQTVRSWLKQALAYDKNSVRALLLQAELEFAAGQYARAIKSLTRVREIAPAHLNEVTELLRQCFQRLANPDGFYAFIQQAYTLKPSTPLLLCLVEHRHDKEGAAEAALFLSTELERHPSLPGLASLAALYAEAADHQSRESLKVLQGLIKQLQDERAAYQCRRCGFTGKQLHWLCPSCKNWGEMSLLAGH